MLKTVLCISGSDPSSGAGMQADLKTLCAHSVYGLTAVTAATAQNLHEFACSEAVTAQCLQQQMQLLARDFPIHAIKIGMLPNKAAISTVSQFLRAHPNVPVVLDPVINASAGPALLAANPLMLIALFKQSILITPNTDEASVILGQNVRDIKDMPDAASELLKLGAKSVLLKGGHIEGKYVVDVLACANSIKHFRHQRILTNARGTGCTLATAIAANLAADLCLEASVRKARKYVHGAIRHAVPVDPNKPYVLNHFWRSAKFRLRH